MRKKVQIKAVYDHQLESLLASLGILDELIAGEIKCAVCECQVSLDNLGAIFPDGDNVGVCCDNERCVQVITDRGAVLSG